MFLNIQSVRHKMDELEIFCNENKIHVVCLAEHWLTAEEMAYCNITNYEKSNYFCREHGYGGVTILCRSGYITKKIEEIDLLSEEKDCEVAAAIILCVYRAPNGDVEKFLQILAEILNILQKRQKRVFIYGDFNINLLSESKLKHDFSLLIGSFGYEILIKQPTRITENSSTCINNCLSNHSNSGDIFTLNCHMSDHLAIINKFKCKQKSANRNLTRIKFRPLSHVKINNCVTYLKELNWEVLLNDFQDTDSMFNYFLKILMNSLNKYVYPY